MMVGGDMLLEDIDSNEGSNSDNDSTTSSQLFNDNEIDFDTKDYVLISLGKFCGQFGRLKKDIFGPRRKVDVVDKNGITVGKKTSLLNDRYYIILENASDVIDLDSVLYQSTNSEAQQIRSEYLADSSDVRTTSRVSRELSSLTSFNPIIGERMSRERKAPERLAVDHGPASKSLNNQSASEIERKRRRLNRARISLSEAKEVKGDSSRAMISDIEAFSKVLDSEDFASPEDFAHMVAETRHLTECNPETVQLSIHGPIYHGRDEYYALPTRSWTEEEGEPLSLLCETSFLLGTEIRDSLEKVLVVSFDSSSSSSSRKTTERLGFLVGRPEPHEDETFSVYFVGENREISRERVPFHEITLMSLNKDDEEDVRQLQSMVLRHSDRSGAAHETIRRQSNNATIDVTSTPDTERSDQENEDQDVRRKESAKMSVQSSYGLRQKGSSGEGHGSEEDEMCAICREDDGEDGDQIVFCDACNLAVHQSCYQVRRIPKGKWFCYACQRKECPSTLLCQLCPNRGGAYMRTERPERWAHVLCTLSVLGVSDCAYPRQEPGVDLSRINSALFKMRCVVCSQRGGVCVQCTYKRCTMSAHPSCAMTGAEPRGLIKDYSTDATGNVSWAWKYYCAAHTSFGGGDRPLSVNHDEEVEVEKRGGASSSSLSNTKMKITPSIKRHQLNSDTISDSSTSGTESETDPDDDSAVSNSERGEDINQEDQMPAAWDKRSAGMATGNVHVSSDHLELSVDSGSESGSVDQQVVQQQAVGEEVEEEEEEEESDHLPDIPIARRSGLPIFTGSDIESSDNDEDDIDSD